MPDLVSSAFVLLDDGDVLELVVGVGALAPHLQEALLAVVGEEGRVLRLHPDGAVAHATVMARLVRHVHLVQVVLVEKESAGQFVRVHQTVERVDHGRRDALFAHVHPQNMHLNTR